MLFKKRLYTEDIRFERVIFSSITETTICMQYNCPHRIKLQYIVVGKVWEGVNNKDLVCRTCDNLMKEINRSLTYQRRKFYYIPR